MASTGVRAVIFDFDGVIVHSEPSHLTAVRAVLALPWATGRASVHIALSDEEYYRDLVFMPDRDLFVHLWRQRGLELSASLLQRLLEAKHEEYRRIVREGGVAAFPGSLELIRACSQRVPVALCTAATRASVEASLGALGVRECFGAMVTFDDVRRSKPDPEPYLLAAQRLGVDPGACVAIEDTVGGCTSALGAGMRVVAVCHTLPAHRLGVATRVVPATLGLRADELLAM